MPAPSAWRRRAAPDHLIAGEDCDSYSGAMFESHFQTFTDEANGAHGAERLSRLRDELARLKLDGFLIPRADEHQNEYTPPSAERLAWLTGFTGSAGTAVVLPRRAALFVDGRYTLQAPAQVDVKAFELHNSGECAPDRWLEKQISAGWRIGCDPWLHTPAQLARYERAIKAAGGVLVRVETNPLDAIWRDRPAPPAGAISIHPPRYAGEGADSKISHVQAALGKADALVLSDPHAVAWAFNIRGCDVAHTPIALCFALLPAKGRPTLYVDRARLSEPVRAALSFLDIAKPEALLRDLRALGAARKLVRFDAATVPARLVQTLEKAGGTADVGADPTALMKARKNKAELRGAAAAHLRDGAAMVEFLAWFAREAPEGRLTEIKAAEALETFRRATKKLKDISFPTISGMGPNGAIVHYRVTETTDRKIARGLFLIDSGAQYEDGTTDITRTLAVGKPTVEMRDRYTRVLKGHVSVATSIFPKGSSGAQIDGFARRALWEAGLDFDHGVGHGVGSYLSVHEGPQRISKLGGVALEPGMILSNEPGYYKTGAYGIRLENLIVVAPRAIKGAEREMLGFETLTLAPMDLSLIEPKLLSREEIAWLNAYHARVRKALTPLVTPATAKWLAGATKPIRN